MNKDIIIEFLDSYSNECILQEGKINDMPILKLGLKKVTPQLMLHQLDTRLTGWLDCPFSDDFTIDGIMSLSQEHVAYLLSNLIYFIDNGTLPDIKDDDIYTKFSIRGFCGCKFLDEENNICTMQESSSDEKSVWLGISEVKPKLIFDDESGHHEICIHMLDDVHLFGRMHLNKKSIERLIPIFTDFVKNGHLTEI